MATTESSTLSTSSKEPTTFVDNVEQWVNRTEGGAEALLRKLQENYSKYRNMESSLVQRKALLKEKIPEYEKTIEMIKVLESKKDSNINTHFELANCVHAHAVIEQPTSVGVWLGANVMLECDFEEAIKIVNTTLTNGQKNLSDVERDLEFIKEQMTITEVNMARVYNFDVKQRRTKRQQ